MRKLRFEVKADRVIVRIKKTSYSVKFDKNGSVVSVSIIKNKEEFGWLLDQNDSIYEAVCNIAIGLAEFKNNF